MKDENQPIRVECIAVKDGSHREVIGFVLIPMLQIPFWNFRKSGMMKSHWHKLLSVSNQYKTFKPELMINVTITDKESAMNDVELTKNDLKIIEECNENPLIKFVNGNIYLGNENDDRDEFIVSIVLKQAKDLGSLGDFDALNHFNIRYKFAWENIVSCTKESANSYSINENVQFKIFSNWKNLLNYFRKFFLFELEIFYKNEIVGECAIKLNDVISTLPIKLDEFQNIFDREHPFCFEDHLKINPKGDLRGEHRNEAIIVYSFGMQCLSSRNVPMLEITSACSRLSCTTPPNLSSMGVQSKRSEESDTIPRTFSYNLSIIDCTFTRRPNAGIWQFRFV